MSAKQEHILDGYGIRYARCSRHDASARNGGGDTYAYVVKTILPMEKTLKKKLLMERIEDLHTLAEKTMGL